MLYSPMPRHHTPSYSYSILSQPVPCHSHSSHRSSSYPILSRAIPFHHTPLHPILDSKGELTDAPQYRPALSVKESEKLLESLDDMTDAEVAAVLSKLKAAVSERIKSKLPPLLTFLPFFLYFLSYISAFIPSFSIIFIFHSLFF
jgi:hypothetical protein